MMRILNLGIIWLDVEKVMIIGVHGHLLVVVFINIVKLVDN